jgi:hypothetical protein
MKIEVVQIFVEQSVYDLSSTACSILQESDVQGLCSSTVNVFNWSKVRA